jgi:type VI secretion system protein ImpK
MTGGGSPSDPFGRSERTIIRPNPAGRRAEPQAMPATPAPAPPVPQTPGADEWAARSEGAPRGPERSARGRAVILQREALITPHPSPVMRAAAPLLLLLGRLRVALLRAPAAQLMEQVADSIKDFEREVRAAGLTPEQSQIATYVVCATADDIVQNIPGEDRHVWTQYSMLSRFFGELLGGVKFFETVDRAKADPTINYPLLELQHACLALGFQGIHRTSAGGSAHLQQIQRSLYETLRRVKKANPELSPRWQGQAVAAAPIRMQVPVWAVGSVVGLLLLALYLVFRMLLTGESEASATALVNVHPTHEVGIERRLPSPPQPRPPQPATGLRAALGPPLEVQEQGSLAIIRMSNLALFAPASATVRDEFKPLIAKIAAVLDKEPGSVKVVGHTDAIPIRGNLRFPSNFHLSLERAKAVAAIIKGQISKPDRVGVEGKGSDVPIAPNDTLDGRARNRRVEILLQRGN